LKTCPIQKDNSSDNKWVAGLVAAAETGEEGAVVQVGVVLAVAQVGKVLAVVIEVIMVNKPFVFSCYVASRLRRGYYAE
jgi:hypothetical protein